MSPPTFEFSPAARLYCQNRALVEEIKKSTAANARKLYKEQRVLISEMREEAYQNIATFVELLLEQVSLLPWDCEGLRLRTKVTYTVKSHIGQKAHWRWLEPVGTGEAKQQGFVFIMSPMPEKLHQIDDDTNQRWILDIITKQQLPVFVQYDKVTNESQRRRIEGLARDSAIGEFKPGNRRYNSLWVPFEAENPFRPTVERIETLLRAIYAIEYPKP